jgi:hypothetical protein
MLHQVLTVFPLLFTARGDLLKLFIFRKSLNLLLLVSHFKFFLPVCPVNWHDVRI